jgi:hypothetical protein
MTAVEASSCPVFKEGWLRLNKKLPFLSGADGVVSKRSRSLLMNIRVAHLILLEFTNHPVCAAKERDLFIEAQRPLLGKRSGMDPSYNQPIPSTPRRNLWDSSEKKFIPSAAARTRSILPD